MALSDLFLDTETRWFLPRAALVSVQEGFAWPEVRHILDYEVTPVVGLNLLDIAGEWAGFDETWLLEACRAQQAAGKNLGSSIKKALGQVFQGGLYAALEKLHIYLSLASPTHLAEEGRRLGCLARLCMEPEWASCGGFWTWVGGLCEQELGVVAASFRQGIQPAYLPLLVHKGDATPEQMESNWQRFCSLHAWVHGQPGDTLALLKLLEELSFLFLMESLPQVPRGPMVASAVLAHGLTPAQAEAVWRGPLLELYGDRPYLASNWARLFPAGSAG